jgi:hypothetical protein
VSSEPGAAHCVAGAPYLSGIYFMVMVDNNLGWALGFMNENRGSVVQFQFTMNKQPVGTEPQIWIAV